MMYVQWSIWPFVGEESGDPMAKIGSAKNDRMYLRIDAKTKRLIRRAATLSSKSVTDFVLTSVTTIAEKVIAEHEKIVLSDEDRDLFFDALINPRSPNAALKKIIRHHRKLAS